MTTVKVTQTDLSPDEFVCDKCDGERFIDHNLCPKCNGYGKVDWIENIIGKQVPLIWGQNTASASSLNMINVRRMIQYVQKTIGDMVEDRASCDLSRPIIRDIARDTDHFLSKMKERRIFQDYSVSDWEPGDGSFRITTNIQPIRSIERIEISFNIS